MAFAAPSLPFSLLKKAPSAVSVRRNPFAANLNAAAALLAQGAVFPLSLFPPDMLLPGHNPNHAANCLLVFHLLMSTPVSEIIFAAV